MRTKFTSGPAVTSHDGQLFTTKGFESQDNGVRITHYINEGSENLNSNDCQNSEQHAFAVPSLLVGNRLLKVAETRSNKQIPMAVTTAAIRSGLLLSAATVAGRIKTALVAHAKELDITFSEAQVTFAAKRKANGVQVRTAAAKKTGANTSATSTAADDQGDQQVLAYEGDVGVRDNGSTDMTTIRIANPKGV